MHISLSLALASTPKTSQTRGKSSLDFNRLWSNLFVSCLILWAPLGLDSASCFILWFWARKVLLSLVFILKYLGSSVHFLCTGIKLGHTGWDQAWEQWVFLVLGWYTAHYYTCHQGHTGIMYVNYRHISVPSPIPLQEREGTQLRLVYIWQHGAKLG